MTTMKIRAFQESDVDAVIALWRACDVVRPWNDPARDIERKLAIADDLLLVGTVDGRVVGTVMAGYEGHRGWTIQNVKCRHMLVNDSLALRFQVLLCFG